MAIPKVSASSPFTGAGKVRKKANKWANFLTGIAGIVILFVDIVLVLFDSISTSLCRFAFYADRLFYAGSFSVLFQG